MTYLSRLYHTLRPLKSIQVRNRITRKLRRPRADTKPAPPARPQNGQWVEPAPLVARLATWNRFRFMGVEREIAGAEDWTPAGVPLLWSYNLHYFDDLCAPEADSRLDWHRDLLSRWLKENPPGAKVAWDPYPISLRVVNWLKWSLASGALDEDLRRSLAIQGRWLAASLEYHLLGNHLLANAKALLFLACFFEGPESDLWLEKGIDLLTRELPEQIQPDGGHFELSPMYQAIITADLLDLLNLARLFPERIPDDLIEALRRISPRMLSWLQTMSHPDGGPAFFNDSALGIAPALSDLEAYALRLGLSTAPAPADGIRSLSNSGYFRLQQGSAVLLMDAAQIGPDYLPGHAHADTLAVELSVAGRRILVNSGTSTYAADELRGSQRSTAAHSTVAVRERNSSDVWSAFRVGRRARPRLPASWHKFGVLYAKAGHDGYAQSEDGLIVWRTCELYPAGLRIVDSLEGAIAPAVSYFHLHPDVEVELDENGKEGRLLLEGGRVMTWHVERARVKVAAGKWYPTFGEERSNRRLELHLDGQECVFSLQW